VGGVKGAKGPELKHLTLPDCYDGVVASLKPSSLAREGKTKQAKS
jgi:hypothetical protein